MTSTMTLPAGSAAFGGRRIARILPVGIVAMALVLAAAGVVTAPAEAVPGTQIAGHRCRTTWPTGATKENTLAALADISSIPGVWCETDVWKLADGTLITWHDPTWKRVADPNSLTLAGLSPTDPVVNATASQVSLVRTKGGEPVPTLEQMIDASAAAAIPLLVEVKNSVPDPGRLVAYAQTVGAIVTYYRTPQTTKCTTKPIDTLKAAGAAIGVRLTPTGACQMTPEQAKAKGVSLVSQGASKATSDYISGFHAVEIKVFVRDGTALTSQDLVARGADRLLVGDPHAALTWSPQ